MTRQATVNKTNFKRLSLPFPVNDAWIKYVCIDCKCENYVHIGHNLLTPEIAYETCSWQCKKCNFIHNKNSDLPFGKEWPADWKVASSNKCQAFWRAFFNNLTEDKSSYYKYCSGCGCLLPYSHFSKHKKFKPLERQIECRACKAAFNALYNPDIRTNEQKYNGNINRTITNYFLKGDNEKINHEDLFERFGSKCFATGTPIDINDRKSWAVGHILADKYLYPMTKTNAVLLLNKVNLKHSEKWPSELYSNEKLVELSNLTGASLVLLASNTPVINTDIDVNNGVDKYLSSKRSKSNLDKRINELKKYLELKNLVKRLNEKNKRILGFE